MLTSILLLLVLGMGVGMRVLMGVGELPLRLVAAAVVGRLLHRAESREV